MLKPPDVTLEDFVMVMQHAASYVAAEELTRFVQWTQEFGEEGS